jgi:hypothetical protein
VIRSGDIEGLASADATRTRAHHFRAANAELAQRDLIATGRAAASKVGTELIDDRRRVAGYVRAGSVDEYADRTFMIADPTGADVVYENTLPERADWAEPVMPAAVVAADLAVSTDVRERRAGLDALSKMRETWLVAH